MHLHILHAAQAPTRKESRQTATPKSIKRSSWYGTATKALYTRSRSD